jgi:glycolate oxidase iron-sulfur subunit
VRHVDRCLSCLSCMTTCPSGVNYMHLVDHARTYIEQTYRRPWPERILRNLLGYLLPRPALFRLALLGASLARPIGRLIPGQSMTAKRLRALFSLAPASVPPASRSEVPHIHPAKGERKARVALLTGCAQQVLMPRINEATIRLLTRLGVEVVVADGAGCCGALNHHIGQHDRAMALVKANVEAWTRVMGDGGLDAVVINASGCGTTVKDYGFMCRTQPEPLKSQAEAISALTLDITEFLTRFGYQPTLRDPGLTVAYHSACSLQHGQRVTAEPKTLLAKAGFKVVEPREPHLCCGSAGTYNLLQPEIANRLRDRKLGHLKATEPDLIAAGNIGCITQLSGDALPVVHTVELLDWMAGGPRPPNLPA